MSYAALDQYKTNALIGDVEDATPHRLIDMLYGGLVARFAAARGAIERKDVGGKAVALTSALDIVQHLKYSLDMEQGGQVAGNLSALYDYMANRVLQANLNSDLAAVDELLDLARSLKSAWAEMPQPA